MKIQEELFKLQDISYKEFHSKLIPTIDKNTIIGIRIPLLRSYAMKIKYTKEADKFLNTLPHTYYDENVLHALLLSEMTDYETFIKSIQAFLPYIDNWAVCDVLKPKSIKKHKQIFIDEIKSWISSKDTYTIRFGVVMLMTYYLDEDYQKDYLNYPLQVKSNEYYVNMAISWFYATALSKHYDEVVKILKDKKLSVWVHNKTIQKAIESYRITKEQKEELKKLKAG
ncbi:MAG: DNA alkylation repair protein [Erysipelotrichaceae bacterium]|nr:DNA alkylation repair protein [Erysipelotrichaceae bacterium]